MIEDYKSAESAEEKNEVFKTICNLIWLNPNRRRVYNKRIKFKVRNDLSETDIGKVFDTWSQIEYKGYKAISKEQDWASLIRQKINNLYTRYFDKEVILEKEYMYLLSTPKRLYYNWLDGAEMDADELTNIIDDSIDKAIKLKHTYQMHKMELSPSAYKKLIETLLRKIFDNCRSSDEYQSVKKHAVIYDFINEDNFYIRYICKSLEGEMLKWQKKYYNVREHKKYTRCTSCGRLIEIKPKAYSAKYCPECRQIKKLEKYKKYNRKRRLPPS